MKFLFILAIMFCGTVKPVWACIGCLGGNQKDEYARMVEAFKLEMNTYMNRVDIWLAEVRIEKAQLKFIDRRLFDKDLPVAEASWDRNLQAQSKRQLTKLTAELRKLDNIKTSIISLSNNPFPIEKSFGRKRYDLIALEKLTKVRASSVEEQIKQEEESRPINEEETIEIYNKICDELTKANPNIPQMPLTPANYQQGRSGNQSSTRNPKQYGRDFGGKISDRSSHLSKKGSRPLSLDTGMNPDHWHVDVEEGEDGGTESGSVDAKSPPASAATLSADRVS